MQEFTTVSSSSYDPAALAAKLTDKSADGWSVAGIVSTGTEVTAFLSRATTHPEKAPAGEPAVEQAAPVVATVTGFEPALPSSFTPAPAPEPAGWAAAPEPAPMAPIAEPAPAYTPAPATQYTPAPAAATPAVPAGWYSDPAGRFELRYWDGGTWTEHVSRAGQQYTDPPVA